ncbi:MAG: shikimate kinase [Pseudobutyrivibrio sp.]|nr:shikimate kinase [Pseudobutyrivibrio sp.]
MKNLFLIGFMGTGKSTIAKFLNRNYGMEMLDMDEAIEAQEGMAISDIFKNKGEAYFRDLETNLILQLKEKSNTVISCGGGVVLRPENVQGMKESGKVILLTAAPETILERVSRNDKRPLLNGHKNIEDISKMMEDRRPRYEAAADVVITVDGKTVEDICKEIMN